MTNLTMTTNRSEYTESGFADFDKQLSNSYGTLPAKAYSGQSSLTLETIINIDSVTTALAFIVYKEGSFMLAAKPNGSLRFSYNKVGGGDYTLSTNTNVADGVHHHLAIALNETGAKLFIDGNLESTNGDAFDTDTLDNENIIYFNGSNNGNFKNSGSALSLAVWNIEKYTANFTPPITTYIGNELGLVSLHNMNGNGLDSSNSTDEIITPSDSSLNFSPFNWFNNGDKAATICGGAYFKFESDSEKVILHFEPSARDPQPTLAIYMDGQFLRRVTATVDVDISPPQETGRDFHHFYEIVIDDTGTQNDRWGGQDTAAKLVAISLGEYGNLYRVDSKPRNILLYGDSISEGRETIVLGDDTDVGSAIACYPLEVGKRLNAEIGVVGFASQGFSKGGEGSVPKVADAYLSIYEGESRDFSEFADLCIFMHGTNDGDNDIKLEALSVLNDLLIRMPNTAFLMLRPFQSNRQAANWQYVVENCSDTSRVFYGDTNGFYSSNRIHPYAYEHLTGIATGVADLAQGVLSGEYTGETSSATVEAKGIPDGAYKTTLNLNGECVFYGDLTYTNNVATAAGVKCAVGNKLTGSVFDELGEHVKCAGLTATTV